MDNYSRGLELFKLWQEITDKLSFKQYVKIGVNLHYGEMAIRVKKISKKKEIHILADKMILISNQIKQGEIKHIDKVFLKVYNANIISNKGEKNAIL